MAEQPKIKTAFPGLHMANGVTMDQLDVVTNSGDTVQQAAQNDNPGQSSDAAATQNNAPDVAQQSQSSATSQSSTADVDMSDEDFNKILAKRTGGKFNSVADLTPTAQPTPQEVEAAKNKKKTDAHLWAIETGFTTKEKYDQAVKDSTRGDRDIALSLFTAGLKEEDKNITAEEATEIFADTFHEGAEENSRLKKTGEDQIRKIAAQYRKENSSILDEIEPAFDQVVQTQTQYQGYKSKVKEIVEKIPKTIPIEVAYTDVDGNAITLTHEFVVEDSVIKKVLDEVRSQSSFTIKNVTSNGKITDKEVEADILNRIKAATYDTAIKSMYEAGLKKGEERAVVIMGNKRNQQQTLNDGQQQLNRPAAALNEYSGLKKAMSEQK